ncbi:MAG: hypothetical protein RI894_1920 [Bacteroidota bacterium]|jgi:hypothetical protein
MNKKTPYYFTLLFLLFGQISKAQQQAGLYAFASATLPIPLELAVFGSDNTPFERFRNSYNQYNRTNLLKAMPAFAPLYSLNGGVSGYLNWVYLELGYHSYIGETSALFANGNKQVIRISSNDFAANIGFGYSNAYLAGYLTGGMRLGLGGPTKLESYTLYPDGFKSYGDENPLNGYYSESKPYGGAMVGLRIIAGAPQIKVGFMADWHLPAIVFEKNTNYSINDGYVLNNIAEVSSVKQSTYIATNWGKYMQDPAKYAIDNGEQLTGALTGLQMRVGIFYNFVEPD